VVDDIIREIEEDLRSDRYKRLWQRYHNYVYAAAVLLVVAVGGYEFWHQRELAARTAEGARFAQAMALADRGDLAGADQAFEALARDAGRGYATLARLYEADLLVKKGDVDGALQRYDAIAADTGVDRTFRDLATLLSATHRADRDDPASLAQRLQPLLAEDNPWRFSARELIAIAALRAGNTAEARANLTRLADDAAAPAGIRARAAELLKTLGE
jgi:hypothetical protein